MYVCIPQFSIHTLQSITHHFNILTDFMLSIGQLTSLYTVITRLDYVIARTVNRYYSVYDADFVPFLFSQ